MGLKSLFRKKKNENVLTKQPGQPEETEQIYDETIPLLEADEFEESDDHQYIGEEDTLDEQERTEQEENSDEEAQVDLMTPDGFKKATYVRAAKRGKFLSRIDEALEDYYSFMNGVNEEDYADDSAKLVEIKTEAIKRLSELEAACDAWLSKWHSSARLKLKYSVLKRGTAVERLKSRTLYEIKQLKDSIQQTESQEGTSAVPNLDIFASKGLPPYEKFKQAVDGAYLAKFIPLAKAMEKRRDSGKDVYLSLLLAKYEDYDAYRLESDLIGTKESFNESKRRQYQVLLDLEKACNDWLDAYDSMSKGLKHKIKTFGLTPTTIRKRVIAPLVRPGGPIENEKRMFEATLNIISSTAQKEKGAQAEEGLDLGALRARTLSYIYDIDMFRKLTYAGATSKRGENLKRIEDLIIKYHEADNEGNFSEAQNILKQLYSATSYWIKLHENDTTESVQFRLPVIRDVRDAARDLLLETEAVSRKELEKLDPSKNLELAWEYRGAERYTGSLLSIDHFRKLTYAGKFKKRGKVISRIDEVIEKYNNAEKEGNESQITALLEQLKLHTDYWLDIHRDDNTASVRYRYPIISSLNQEVKSLLEMRNEARKEGQRGSEKEAAVPEQEGAVEGKAVSAGRRLLPTVTEFQKLTYVKAKRRDSYLKKIDSLIMDYDKYRVKTQIEESEQENVVNVLGNLYKACMLWLQMNEGKKDSSVRQRRIVIQGMVGEEGQVANETNFLLQNKVLNQDVDISEKIINNESVNGVDPGELFKAIGNGFSDELGGESQYWRAGLSASIGPPIVPGTNIKLDVTLEYDGERTGFLEDPEKDITTDNIRSKISSEHKINIGLTGNAVFLASLRFAGKFGFYTQVSANTSKECAALTSFCSYNKLRSSRLMLKYLTNRIYGKAWGKEGYSRAEQAQSEALNVLGKNPKNYIEEGTTADLQAKGGVKVVYSGDINTSFRGFRKRITRDVIRQTLLEMGAPGELPYDKLADEYLKLSGIEDGEVKKEDSAEIHRRIRKNRQSKKRVRLTRVVTSAIMGANLTRDYKNGELRRIRVEGGFDKEEFFAGKSYYNKVLKLIQLLQDYYGESDTDRFNILDLNLTSFKNEIMARIEEYPPLVQLRKESWLSRFIQDKSIKVAVEIDTKKKILKLFITNIKGTSTYIGTGVTTALSSMPPLMILEKTGVFKMPLPFSVGAGTELEYSKRSEEMLGFWRLPNSSFAANANKLRPPTEESGSSLARSIADASAGESEGDPRDLLYASVITELREHIGSQARQGAKEKKSAKDA